ncbi:MAG: efflux RND transporter periplasmic adaptor subunit [Hyphomicrobiales bacterium]
MIRRIAYFLLVTMVLGGLGGAIAFYAFEWKPKFLAQVILGSPRPTETVSAETARADTWQPQISGIGTLTASDGIDITPQVGGIVAEVNFESGQDVKKGQLLITLDTDAEEAEMRSLTAQLANAEKDVRRRESLFAKGFAPKADVDQLRSQRDSLQGNVDRIRAVIAQKSIHAPWDGRSGFKNVSPGKFVAPGQPVVWLQSIDPIFADFTVTEADYGRIKTGLPVTARFNAWPGADFKGEIATTDARMSDATRMITVRAKFANPEGKLLPGMYAEVLVDAGRPEQVVTVPQTAVTYTLYGDNVFVVVPASKSDATAKYGELAIERRFVKTGEVRGGRVQIAEGLKPGEEVVTAGHNKIDQGSKVVIDNSIALRTQDSTTIQ